MDSEASLRTLLSTANYGATSIDAIVEFCCENLNELASMSSKHLDTGIANLHKSLSTLVANRGRVRLNVSKCILLHALRLHFFDRARCNALLENADIAALNQDDILQMKADYSESTLITTTTGLGEVKIPKLTNLKWPDFKSSLLELLGRSFGQSKIPLLYIIRENDLGDFDETYDDRRAKLTMCISLNGPAYTADNGDVFSILVQHTDNSEGSSIVQSHEKRRNGRKAWKELIKHFEGDTYKLRSAQDAGSILKNASYSGMKKNFSFGDYYKLHSGAHAKLLRADKPMTTEQKIDTFVQGIECSIAQSIVVSISGTPANRTSFDAYYNAIASRIELANSLMQKSNFKKEDRYVNQEKSERNKRSRDKNEKFDKNKRFDRAPKDKSSASSTDRRYTASQWNALSKEQQQAVKRHNSKNRSSRSPSEQPSRRQQQNQHQYVPQQQQITNYIPPPPPYPRSIAQYSHTPTFYDQFNYGNRSINNFSLPPRPDATMIHQPHSVPSNQQNFDAAGAINAHSGAIGQSFGSFGPPHPQP